MLAVQYGMGGDALADQLGKTHHDANQLLRVTKIPSHNIGSGITEFSHRALETVN